MPTQQKANARNVLKNNGIYLIVLDGLRGISTENSEAQILHMLFWIIPTYPKVQKQLLKSLHYSFIIV